MNIVYNLRYITISIVYESAILSAILSNIHLLCIIYSWNISYREASTTEDIRETMSDDRHNLTNFDKA